VGQARHTGTRYLVDEPLRVATPLIGQPLASPLRRLAAIVIDGVIVLVPTLLVIVLAAGVSLHLREPAAIAAMRGGLESPDPQVRHRAQGDLARFFARLEAPGLPAAVKAAVGRNRSGRNAARRLRHRVQHIPWRGRAPGEPTAPQADPLRDREGHPQASASRCSLRRSGALLLALHGIEAGRHSGQAPRWHPSGSPWRPSASPAGGLRAIRGLPPHPRHPGAGASRSAPRPQSTNGPRSCRTHGGPSSVARDGASGGAAQVLLGCPRSGGASRAPRRGRIARWLWRDSADGGGACNGGIAATGGVEGGSRVESPNLAPDPTPRPRPRSNST